MPTFKRMPPYILIAPFEDEWAAVKDGTRYCTIRPGFRDYQVGDKAMLCCHIRNCAVMTTITTVCYGNLELIPIEYIKGSGFRNHQEALESMWQFYIDLKIDDPVTAVAWGKLEGVMAHE